MNFLFRQGRIIDPAQGKDEIADVLILQGRLADIQPRITVSSERLAEIEEIDASGEWLAPGLVDMHVHLREPGDEHKETIASGTNAAVAGGYTAVACMPNTKPVNDSAAVTRFILDRARENGACRVYPVGAISKGSAGEILTDFGELRDAGAVAVSDDGMPVMNSQLMRRALESAKCYDLLVISHAEDLNLSAGGLMNEGPVASAHGVTGIPNVAEEVMIARDLLLAEWTGSRVHIAHVSTAGAVRSIRDAKTRGVAVTAETAPHYFTLTDESLTVLDPIFKMNPPLRRPADLQAIRAGLADGTLDAIATDHAPHSRIEKDVKFEHAANGIIGLESALPLILELVREGVLSPLEAIAKVSCNPAGILRIPAGTLAVGKPADLTVIDPEIANTLDCQTFQSKSRNCPFHGRQMKGRVEMTLVQGKVAFCRKEEGGRRKDEG